MKPVKRLRRWVAGERVNSASRLNQVIDEVNDVREILGNRGLGPGESLARFASIFVQTVNPVGEDDGVLEGEWTVSGADGVLVYMWPELYPSTGYTYTNNNTRELTVGSVDEEMVPEITTGEILRVEFMYLPGPDAVVWVDTNRIGRMWGEVAA